MDTVHDPAWHGADVGAAVAADIGFIPYAAKADAGIFALQRLCNALSDAGLAGARGADKAEDRTGLLLLEVHDRDLLNDALLDFFQSEMILLEHGFRLVQIDLPGIFIFPGKAGDEIQIIVEHAGFRAVLSLLLIAVKDLIRLLAGGLIHTGFLDQDLEPAHIRDIFGMHFVQFLLQVFNLLFDRGFAVDLLITLLLGASGFIIDMEHLQIFIQDLFHGFTALLFGILSKQGIALLIADGEPGGHDGGNLTDRSPLLRISAGQRSPLEL